MQSSYLIFSFYIILLRKNNFFLGLFNPMVYFGIKNYCVCLGARVGKTMRSYKQKIKKIMNHTKGKQLSAKYSFKFKAIHEPVVVQPSTAVSSPNSHGFYSLYHVI